MDGPVHHKSERNMSAYGAAPSAPMLPQQGPSLSNNYIPYPPLPNLPPNASNPIFPDVDPQLAPPTQAQTPSNNNTSKIQGHAGETKARLRKACDSCSVRKVKCDEQQPCKACEGLQIPCTFERPSKRRGPPNKHAESLKRKYDSPAGPAMSQPQPSSPTHAAHTLAYFSQQQVLSAETICPLSMLERLVDDYFTFIHPLVPLPHEPSFRDAFNRRQDLTNPTFVALVASMLGYLVACFPRRPRQHIREGVPMEHQQQMDSLYSNPMDLVDRCHKVAMEALGPAYLDRKMSVHDAVISYLQGLTCVQTFNRQSAIHYFKQCMTISATVGLHKVNVTSTTHTNGHALPTPRMTANGHALEGPHHVGVDQLMRELGVRTFWALFAGVKLFQQAGVSQWDLLMPPATPSHPYPPLPVEVDDGYITPEHVHLDLQPPGLVPVITGFNANIRVLSTYNDLAAMELVRGVDNVVDWERQKRALEESLQSVKRMLDGLPGELVLSFRAPSPRSREPKYPSPNPESTVGQELAQYATNGFDNTRIDFNRPEERRRIQYEIQKANIYTTQLATRLHLVEKYWNLYDAYNLKKSGGGSSDRASSPGMIAPILDKYDPSTHFSTTEQDLAAEREDIVKTFLILLGQINEINTEALGNSFISEINRIARVLLDAPLVRKGNLAQGSETYVRASLAVLEKLDLASPTGDWLTDEDEVPQLWATLRGYQASFAQSGGFGGEV
ncbi:hypothetical protein HO173_007717 [Letharia columbiana]|uniref:Zn(2)-C6 fungal-type domain-containing protein n=1 Tax=Letharia columbiana TaxID=112416 RepID=A0A8H6FT59_9LECA|nr:uncharacterized protein HO173_007717 [Letharia columbiana]KAF6234295.1 hypothetical protein HO173_007717 [Letharia columbiana]